MKKDKATFGIRIYPSTHKALRRMAAVREVSLAELINQLVKGI